MQIPLLLLLEVSMSLPTSIKTLLRGSVVEWARIEFKTTWDPQASLKTICAFANDIDNWGGGYIVIGVSQDNEGQPAELVGVPPEKVDAYLKDMLNKCKLIQPSYMPITEVSEYEGKLYIVIWAPGGSVRPYSSPKSIGKQASERIYWIRKMASTIAPTEEEKRDLYQLSNNVPFDDRINHEAELSDLNLPLIQSYLKEVQSSLYASSGSMDFKDLCRSMNIAEGPDEYLKPKNVGLLFFSMTPEKWMPYTQIDIVELPEGEGGNIIRERTFRGPIHQQLRDALLYLENNIIVEDVVKSPDVAEAERFFNYPYAALEESLSNAVYHKGYDSREPIEVRVLPDRIEILSHPGADRSISIEGLKHYRAVSRRYRNRRVGEFLKELHLTEGRNTGFRKILTSLQQNGSPAPRFETDEDRIYFLTTIYARTSKAQDKCGPHTTGSMSNEPTWKARDIREEVVARQNAILTYMQEHPTTTIAQIADALTITKSTIDRDIRSLKDQGRLYRVGSRASGTWHTDLER